MRQNLKIVIIGPSGSGKGTQADLLERKYGLKHISVGGLFRREMARGTIIGKEAARYVTKGLWVPTSLTIKILKNEISRCINRGFILDGFPRLPDQPKLLDNLLIKHNTCLDLVIHLKIKPGVILARRQQKIKKMGTFYPEQKRKDESEEAIRNRFASYKETIKPILSFYRKRGILIEIDGERPVKVIFEDILRIIKYRQKYSDK